MNHQDEGKRLIVGLGTESDTQEIAALLQEGNHRPNRYTHDRPRSEDDATLVLRLPSGELAASLLMGIARKPEELLSQLSYPVRLASKDWPVLTTAEHCSLPNGLYLEVLRYVVLHIAMHTAIDGSFFAWQIGIQNTRKLGNRQCLENMGYQIRSARLAESLVTIALPRDCFKAAYLTQFSAPMRSTLPAFKYVGNLPFRNLH